VALAATLGAGALTGCESKSGVAAFVGSTSIQTSELSGYVNRGVQTLSAIGVQAAPNDVQSAWLGNLIERDVARQVAQQQGISLSPGDVNLFLSRFAATRGGGLGALRDRAARNGISEVDLPVVFETLALENAIAGKLAPQLVAPDTAARQAFAQQQQLFPGLTYDQVNPLFRELLVFDQRSGVALNAMREQARQIGIRVNPRFGSWNADTFSLGAPPNDLSQAVAPSGAPAPVEGGEAPAPVPAS
jgi:hypothetical protein